MSDCAHWKILKSTIHICGFWRSGWVSIVFCSRSSPVTSASTVTTGGYFHFLTGTTFRTRSILYAHKFLRPMEGFYWISLFELFGFNKVAFHLCSLLLLAGAAVLMGVSLDRAFPGRRTCVSMAVLLAFFLPPVSCLTYVLFTDNSRLSMLLFWASVITFQRWAQKSSPWRGLALPVVFVCGFIPHV